MAKEQLFASFLLDREDGLEIALRAEQVAEATPVMGKIQKLPATVDFVEGIMHLRDDVIPLVNLKKRFGLSRHEYATDAKVAVVHHQHRNYGLLFDDIREVFSVAGEDIEQLDGCLQTEDRIISALIKRERGVRTVELLELGRLFPGSGALSSGPETTGEDEKKVIKNKKYQQFVVFSLGEQLYGVEVSLTQEITFFESVNRMYKGGVEDKNPPYSAAIADLFRHGNIDGSLTLRGRTIPVLSGGKLLNCNGGVIDEYLGESTRILILAGEEYVVGLVVEEVKKILSIAEEDILADRRSGDRPYRGIYAADPDTNIMLLDVEYLVHDKIGELKALARLSSEAVEKEEALRNRLGAHHLITENCYLLFRIGRLMAVQLKDVQEIIERDGVLGIPGEHGFASGVINLRGQVVPVVDLRAFYGMPKRTEKSNEQKLIICRTQSQVVALEVDAISTIYKQEKYQKATSISKDLAKRKDTLDRLIVFDNGEMKNEQVLVVNVHNLLQNHLDLKVD